MMDDYIWGFIVLVALFAGCFIGTSASWSFLKGDLHSGFESGCDYEHDRLCKLGQKDMVKLLDDLGIGYNTETTQNNDLRRD